VLDSIDFGDDDLPRPGKVWDDAGPSLSELVKSSAAGRPTAPVASTGGTPDEAAPAVGAHADGANAGGGGVQAAWGVAVESLKSQVGVYGVALQSRIDRVDADGYAILRMPASCETFARMWERNGKKDVVRDALSRALGRDIGIRIEVDAAPAAGPTGAGASGPPVPPGSGSNAAGRPPDAGRAGTGPRPAGPPPAGGSRPPPGATATPPAPPPAPTQRITQEQVDALRQQSPLVEALVQQLNAQIVKVE
jgi:hypothetical protein